MTTEDYINNPIRKLEELEKKSDLENTFIKKKLDTQSAERRFEREEKRKDNINSIGIVLMRFGGLMVVAFVLLTFASGLFSNKLPQTTGFVALSELFSIIVSNSKIIILIILGYFFRDYALDLNEQLRGGK